MVSVQMTCDEPGLKSHSPDGRDHTEIRAKSVGSEGDLNSAPLVAIVLVCTAKE